MKLLILFSSWISICSALYSTKTAYLDSFTPEQLKFIENNLNYQIDNCHAEQIYLVLRHGSRYPSAKQITRSNKFLNDLRQYRSNQAQRNFLDDLYQSFDDVVPHSLSHLGEQEMKNIATRFKHRFGHILSGIEGLDVKSSFKDRSVKSAHSFLMGWHSDDENKADKSIASIVIDNRMMRLFDECERYLRYVKESPLAFQELNVFKVSTYIGELVDEFKKRHDIVGLDSVKPSLVSELFTLCNIEEAHRMPSNWCKLFRKEDYEVLAYLNDMKSYWIKSYGNEDINTKTVLLLIQDLFAEMEKQIEGDQNRNSVVLRFGHAENIIPLVTSLGLFNNSIRLDAGNFELNRNRTFRNALLTPFSSNVAFVLYSCQNSDYKVRVYLNELPLSEMNAGRLLCAGGSDPSTCNFVDFKSQMKEYLNMDLNLACRAEDQQTFKIEL